MINRWFRPCLRLLLLLLATVSPAAAQTSGVWEMESEPGEWVGAGQSHHFDSTQGAFYAKCRDWSGDGHVDDIEVSYFPANRAGGWLASFTTTQLGVPLETGTYQNAQRASFATPGHPGLDVRGDGRGSNTLTGSFTISELEFDYGGDNPRLVRLVVSFEQRSGGASEALRGTIDYQDTPAPIIDAPDLAGSGLVLTEERNERRGVVRSTLTGQLEIANLGVQRATRSRVRVYLSSTPILSTGSFLLKEITLKPLRPGRGRTQKLRLRLPEGNTAAGRYVLVLLDAPELLAEQSEFNNLLSYGPMPHQ